LTIAQTRMARHGRDEPVEPLRATFQPPQKQRLSVKLRTVF
jgi:hypothetical protein